MPPRQILSLLVSRCYRSRRRSVVRAGVPLDIPVVHLHYAGKENGEERNKENDEGEDVLVGEITHKWQPCSTLAHTIVK